MDASAEVQAVLDKIRHGFAAKGVKSLKDFVLQFRRLDTANINNKIDQTELQNGLQKSDIIITETELSTLFSYLDKNNDGKLNFDEFLNGIRGNLTGERFQVVDQAFKKLDKDGNGIVTFEDLRYM
eukprot:TRINITY_DN3964_c0_g3_i7.p2 TRINITY_DN3964_c0_g3~~TRINITY_DN3964_c0_g3_i7.p2  ORF type:complete len:126 (-),score=32.21 TRINITY_DN3964_c0_g3_i7:43-420(-)